MGAMVVVALFPLPLSTGMKNGAACTGFILPTSSLAVSQLVAAVLSLN